MGYHHLCGRQRLADRKKLPLPRKEIRFQRCTFLERKIAVIFGRASKGCPPKKILPVRKLAGRIIFYDSPYNGRHFFTVSIGYNAKSSNRLPPRGGSRRRRDFRRAAPPCRDIRDPTYRRYRRRYIPRPRSFRDHVR